MIIVLAIRITRTANMFPATEGISRYFGPSTIVSEKQINFLKELVFSFGDYGQGHQDFNPKSNNIPRTKDVIYLQSAQQLQRGHEVMDLATGELIKVVRFDKCMMTRMVVDRVEQLATQQGYKTLKFFNRKKEELFLEDIDLLAGLQEVRENIINESNLKDLPPGELAPGGLLSGPDEPLSDKEIEEEEVADLL